MGEPSPTDLTVDRSPGTSVEARFVANMRAIRKARNMTQAELGRSCEPPLDTPTIAKIEARTRRLKLGEAHQICVLLGTDLDVMLSESVAVEATWTVSKAPPPSPTKEQP